MALFNKIQAALTTFTQENNVALAQANFHLSLLNIEAPAGYRGLWTTFIGKGGRATDGGSIQETAAVLGTLFEDVVPRVPGLFEAYGKRVSEILEYQTKNLRDGKAHNEHANTEATSIWAAVTSGKAAVAIHMLACMLARTCSPSEAISIWEEMLEGRKKELSGCDRSSPSSGKGVPGAWTSLSRKQLAEWDSSVRVWLRTADKSQGLNHKQLLIILKSLDLPVHGDLDVHAGVTFAWKTAMSTVERLINGNRHSVWSGAVLLGLSAWHLYPDLTLLGTHVVKNLRPNDSLIAPGGYAVIGLQGHEPKNSRGVYWSLPLGNVRDYSGPEIPEEPINSVASGISIDDLWRLL